jgi:virulence-associated protein VagC
MQKFNKRWSITSVDSYEDSFRKFKVRILNVFKGIDDNVTDESITAFCQYYGIKEVLHPLRLEARSTNIIDRLNQEEDEKEFYRLIELIFSLDISSTMGYDRRYKYSKEILLRSVVGAIELSDVNVSILTKDEEVILYPKGEQILDKFLIDEPFSFLNNESSEHFIQALQFYQSKKFIKSAESLRRSLEEFLRFKLSNSKGLNANILELQTRLKSLKKDAQVRSMVFSTFSCLDQYFNENSKHNDGNINEVENEFLIYQTGLLMRYLNGSI